MNNVEINTKGVDSFLGLMLEDYFQKTFVRVKLGEYIIFKNPDLLNSEASRRNTRDLILRYGEGPFKIMRIYKELSDKFFLTILIGEEPHEIVSEYCRTCY